VNTFQAEFHHRLRLKMDDYIRETTAAIVSGVLDQSDYKMRCGELRACEKIAEFCDEIQSDMTEGK